MSRTGNATTSPHGRARGRTAGFTMIELIVVIVLVGVLAGMIAPRLIGSHRAAAVRESARQFHLAAQYARAYAVSRGVACRLVIDAQEQRYHLMRERQDSPGEFEPMRADLGHTHTLADRVRFGEVRIVSEAAHPSDNDAATYVTFTVHGQADNALIELTDDATSWTVRIVASSGRTTLVRGRADALPQDRIDLDA